MLAREFIGVPAVFASEVMQKLVALVEKVAVTNATILITGESGSGKEIVARAVHHYSLRSSKSWVDLNCAALPENLLESELFGHEKGAFSGADICKPGLFELADQGTLFLDEIGDLDPRMQVKLLRVLDGASYYRVGGVKKVTVDVRLIAATNQDLSAAVREGRFRSDLYHRLSQIPICVPPLRERRDDIVPLAQHYLAHEKSGFHSRICRRALRSARSHPVCNSSRRFRIWSEGRFWRCSRKPGGISKGPRTGWGFRREPCNGKYGRTEWRARTCPWQDDYHGPEARSREAERRAVAADGRD
jgi:DNA-binding NtrC family response regulator